MGFSRRQEGLLDPDMELSAPQREPHSPASPQRRGLFQLTQPDHSAVEMTRLRLAKRRSGDLNMIKNGI